MKRYNYFVRFRDRRGVEHIERCKILYRLAGSCTVRVQEPEPQMLAVKDSDVIVLPEPTP